MSNKHDVSAVLRKECVLDTLETTDDYGNCKHSKVLPLIKEISIEKDIFFSSLLDVGCGRNPLATWLSRFERGVEPYAYCAIEIDEDIRAELDARGVRSACSFDEIKDQFDLVIATEVLEHIVPSESVDFLKTMGNHSRKMVALTVPNYEHWPTMGLSKEARECRWWPDFPPVNPTSTAPHDHKQYTTPALVSSLMKKAFSKDQWDVKVVRAWPWRIEDVDRHREYVQYFKVFAIATRR